MVMEACNSVTSEGSYPKILPVDFDNMSDFLLDEAIDREGLVFRIHPWFSDISFKDLLNQIG
jgi:hypothetical protein